MTKNQSFDRFRGVFRNVRTKVEMPIAKIPCTRAYFMFRSFCRALKKFSLAVGAQRTEGPLACGDPIKQIILYGVNASSKAIEKFEADAVTSNRFNTSKYTKSDSCQGCD